MNKEAAFDLIDLIHEEAKKEIFVTSAPDPELKAEIGSFWIEWFVELLYEKGYSIAERQKVFPYEKVVKK